MLQSHLLSDHVQLASHEHVLVLNSAADPFVSVAAQGISTGTITLAEDNIASLQKTTEAVEHNEFSTHALQHVAFHEYTSHEPAATMDVAVMNLVYQPSNTWMLHALEVASYALKPGGRLYIAGAKDRGVLSIAKRMQVYFGNVETLAISKGQRVLCSRNSHPPDRVARSVPSVFAQGKLDEGTHFLLELVEVRQTDEVLDIGCGAGFIGLHIARLAHKGSVTMVDVSLATVAMAQRNVEESGLTNIQVLPSNGVQAVFSQRFDLVVTNPPFHMGGIQTTEMGERFIREAAQVLRPTGRFYLVANRFLKYEPTLRTYFQMVDEVGGDMRYKVLQATKPILHPPSNKGRDSL